MKMRLLGALIGLGLIAAASGFAQETQTPAKPPDAKASDAKASDAKASDAKASDAKASDAQTPDKQASKVTVGSVLVPASKGAHPFVETKSAQKHPCVIVSRMNIKSQIASHFFTFGVREKHFVFVEGTLPDKTPFHSNLTDHDIRGIEKKGGEVVFLDLDYSPDDLKQARTACTEASLSETKREP